MPADFCMGCKTLPEIQFILLHGGVNLPLNSGRLLHGWQNLARDSGQTLLRDWTHCKIVSNFNPRNIWLFRGFFVILSPVKPIRYESQPYILYQDA